MPIAKSRGCSISYKQRRVTGATVSQFFSRVLCRFESLNSSFVGISASATVVIGQKDSEQLFQYSASSPTLHHSGLIKRSRSRIKVAAAPFLAIITD